MSEVLPEIGARPATWQRGALKLWRPTLRTGHRWWRWATLRPRNLQERLQWSFLISAAALQAFTGADALFLVTTFQGAAAEIQHGKNAIDAAKEV